MESMSRNTVKTTVILEKGLMEEIDRYNPFRTRKKFLDQACKTYLRELRRKLTDDKLAAACAAAAPEDSSVNEEWEPIALEVWE